MEEEWRIDAGAVTQFTKMFTDACAAQGSGVDRLGKAEAGAVLSMSGLPVPTLLQIWSLADLDGDDRLDLREYLLRCSNPDRNPDLNPDPKPDPNPDPTLHQVPTLLLARAADCAEAAAATHLAAAAAPRVSGGGGGSHGRCQAGRQRDGTGTG